MLLKIEVPVTVVFRCDEVTDARQITRAQADTWKRAAREFVRHKLAEGREGICVVSAEAGLAKSKVEAGGVPVPVVDDPWADGVR